MIRWWPGNFCEFYGSFTLLHSIYFNIKFDPCLLSTYVKRAGFLLVSTKVVFIDVVFSKMVSTMVVSTKGVSTNQFLTNVFLFFWKVWRPTIWPKAGPALWLWLKIAIKTDGSKSNVIAKKATMWFQLVVNFALLMLCLHYTGNTVSHFFYCDFHSFFPLTWFPLTWFPLKQFPLTRVFWQLTSH